MSDYTVFDYGRMVADDIRTSAYVESMEQAITPGSVVLDIGTGTGFFAIKACEMGAARVYAVEPANAAAVARGLVAEHGLTDRVRVVQGLSTALELPEPVDVVVADLRGKLPAYNGNIPSMIDARDRLLREGGVLIPKRDRLYVALAFLPRIERDLSVWERPFLGVDMSLGSVHATSEWVGYQADVEHLVAEGLQWSEFDYETVTDGSVAGTVSWEIPSPVRANALALWFDAELYGGVRYSTAPSEPELVYGRGAYPLSRTIDLAAGDQVTVDLHADLVGDDYVWRWSTRVRNQALEETVSLDQSSVQADPRSMSELRLRAGSHVPSMGTEGETDLFIMNLMDGASSVGEIAEELHREFPEQFPTIPSAHARVGDLAVRYGSRLATGPVAPPSNSE